MQNETFAGPISSIRTVFATITTVVTTGANVAVWRDLIQGWAAAITIVIGAPTALLILVYWYLKVRKAFKEAV